MEEYGEVPKVEKEALKSEGLLPLVDKVNGDDDVVFQPVAGIEMPAGAGSKGVAGLSFTTVAVPGLAQIVRCHAREGSHFPAALPAHRDAGWNPDVEKGMAFRGNGKGGVWLGDDWLVGEGGEKVHELVVIVAIPALPFDTARKICQVAGGRQFGAFHVVDSAYPPFVITSEQDQIEGANLGVKPPFLCEFAGLPGNIFRHNATMGVGYPVSRVGRHGLAKDWE